MSHFEDLDTKDAILHVETAVLPHQNQQSKEDALGAISAEKAEAETTVLHALKTHRWAVFWSVMVSMTVVSNTSGSWKIY